MNDWTEAETRVEHAGELYDQGRWAEAAAELRAAIDVNPHVPAWHFNLALTLEAMEEYSLACEAHKKVLELEPDDLEAMTALGVNATRMGAYEDALARFERIERIAPTYEAAYCNRIATYGEMGDHDNAETMFYLARQLTAECPLCYYNLGNSLYDRGLYDQAIDCWKRTLAMDGCYRQANVRIAEAYWACGNTSRARRYYLAELKVAGDDPEAFLDFGELLVEIGQPERAEANFRKALELAPDDPGAYFCLGELAARRGDMTGAEEHLRRVLLLDGRYTAAHLRLGELMLRCGRPKDATGELLAELRNCGDDASTLLEVGQLLMEAGGVRYANSVFRRVVRLKPRDAQAHHDLAVTFFMLDRHDEGVCHARKALKLPPDHLQTLYNLALACLRRGQLSRARRYVSRAITVAPNDGPLRQLSRRLGLWGSWLVLKGRLDLRRRRRGRS